MINKLAKCAFLFNTGKSLCDLSELALKQIYKFSIMNSSGRKIVVSFKEYLLVTVLLKFAIFYVFQLHIQDSHCLKGFIE